LSKATARSRSRGHCLIVCSKSLPPINVCSTASSAQDSIVPWPELLYCVIPSIPNTWLFIVLPFCPARLCRLFWLNRLGAEKPANELQIFMISRPR